MPEKRIYTLGIPEDSQKRDEQRAKRQIAKHGVVSGGTPIAEDVSSDPDETTLDGEFRGQYAKLSTEELDELFTNPDIDEVPFYTADNDGERIKNPEDGYYALDRCRINPVDPRGEGLHYEWSVDMTHKGTANDYWRGVETVREDVTNPFGTGETATVGVPASAEQVFWWDETDGSRSVQSPTDGSTGIYGDVDLYDLDPVSDTARILYSMPMEREGQTDVAVWDDRGVGSKLDDNGIPQWFEVFVTSHDPEGELVVTNGVIRLFLSDGSDGDILAEEWINRQWDDAGLSRPSDVSLFDVDLTQIGMMQVRAQLTFNVGGDLYALNMAVDRGADSVLFTVPTNESPDPPTALENWLEPIASGRESDLHPEKVLISRSEVQL